MSAKLSIDQLRREHCYLVLSIKQQKMIEVYLATGDKVKAVQAAFNTKSSQVAKVMTYHYFRKPHVVACLAVAAGGDGNREKFNLELQRAIRNPKVSRNQIAALRLQAQLNGYLDGMPEPTTESEDEPQRFAIGSVIVQDGQKVLVVAQEMD